MSRLLLRNRGRVHLRARHGRLGLQSPDLRHVRRNEKRNFFEKSEHFIQEDRIGAR